MKEALEGKVSFPDWDPADFDVIMDWIYGVDTSGLTNENLGNLWAIADFLLLEDFQDACVDFVHDHKSDSVAESLKLINSTCDIKRLAVASCEFVMSSPPAPPRFSGPSTFGILILLVFLRLGV